MTLIRVLKKRNKKSYFTNRKTGYVIVSFKLCTWVCRLGILGIIMLSRKLLNEGGQ